MSGLGRFARECWSNRYGWGFGFGWHDRDDSRFGFWLAWSSRYARYLKIWGFGRALTVDLYLRRKVAHPRFRVESTALFAKAGR